MNSTSAYIIVCMLLLSALISLIVLLITVSEQPDWLLAERPPRRYIDFAKYSRDHPPTKSPPTSTWLPTTARAMMGSRIEPTLATERPAGTHIGPLLSTEFSGPSAEPSELPWSSPSIDLSKSSTTTTEPPNITVVPLEMITVSAFNGVSNLPENIITADIISSSTVSFIEDPVTATMPTVNETMPMIIDEPATVTPSLSIGSINPKGADGPAIVLKTDANETVERPTIATTVASVVITVTQELPALPNNSNGERSVMPLGLSAANDAENLKILPPASLAPETELKLDSNRVNVARSSMVMSSNDPDVEAGTVNVPISTSMENALSKPPQTPAPTAEGDGDSDAPIRLTLERSDAPAERVIGRAGASATSILDALAAAPTKAPRAPLSTARVRLSGAVFGGAQELPANELFGARERRIEQILLKEVFSGRETAPASGLLGQGPFEGGANETTTGAPAKPSKYLSILIDDDTLNGPEGPEGLAGPGPNRAGVGATLYLPKNNGEIALARWDESTRSLTTLDTIKTQLRRVHRMKLIPLAPVGPWEDPDAFSGSVLNPSGPAESTTAEAISADGKPRFVAVDGDRLKRIALLNAHGELLEPLDVEIPSNVGAKDLCVDDGRIYVLSRQALNGSSEIFVYDTARLGFQRRVALRTPPGENCNFIEARANFVYVSCQSAVLRIDMDNETAPPRRFSAPEGSYALAILPLRDSGRLLAAQRGRAELHLFDAASQFAARLVNVAGGDGAPSAIFTSLAVTRRTTAPSRGTSTILALEYITNKIHAFVTDADVQ